MMGAYTKKVIRGATYLFIFSVLASFISYFTRIYLARNLTLEEFGLFFAVFSLFNFLVIFKDLGLGQAMVKFLSEFQANNEFNKSKTSIFIVTSIQLSLAFIISAFMIFFAKFLSENYFKNPESFYLIIILSLWFFLSTIQGIVFQVFYGLKYFFIFSLKDFIKNFIFILLLILLFSLGFGLFSPALAWLFTTILLALFFFPLMLSKFNFFKYRLVNQFEISKKLFWFGVPLIFLTAGSLVIGYLDTLMLTYFRSLEEVGIYNVVLPSAMLLIFLGRSIALTIFPIGSELWIKNQKKKLSNGLSLMLKYSFLAVMPIALSLIIFSDLFLKIFFGPEYIAGSLSFKILLVGVIFYIIAQINNSIISSIGMPKKVTKIVLWAALLNILVNLILIPIFGIVGAAFATTMSYMLVCFLSILEIRKVFDFNPPWSSWIKTLFSGILFVLSIEVMSNLFNFNLWLELIVVLFASILVYLFALFITRVITYSEIKGLIKNII